MTSIAEQPQLRTTVAANESRVPPPVGYRVAKSVRSRLGRRAVGAASHRPRNPLDLDAMMGSCLNL